MTYRITALDDIDPPLAWRPDVGSVTETFLDKQRGGRDGPSPEELDRILEETRRILGRCVNPVNGDGAKTGLVVGYVQSGKTLSFTTLCALAHDNGFRLIIVLGGSTNALLLQTTNRLKDDLRTDDLTAWDFYVGPKPGSQDGRMLNEYIRNIDLQSRSRRVPRVPIVTVLKKPGNIRNLNRTLVTLEATLDFPVLIVDDESDQASLNLHSARNLRSGTRQESPTYAALKETKGLFPNHTFVQYTATPQANLLTALDSELAPEFVEVITPGSAYTGGELFFAQNSPHLKIIPPQDLNYDGASATAPPRSLINAINFFLVAAGVSYASREAPFRRTMMVHPSVRTRDHSIFERAVGNYLDSLKTIVNDFETGDPVGWNSFCEDDLMAVYEEFKSFNQDIPAFSTLEGFVRDVVVSTKTKLMNQQAMSRQEMDALWDSSPFLILIGGFMLDRGFTVKQICTTYMPRQLAQEGAADSFQQRARFFGYHKKYLGYCRIFLPREECEAYKSYVTQEKILRELLDGLRGRPLKDWVLKIHSNTRLHPTRKPVIGRPIIKLVSQGWIVPRNLHHGEAPDKNNKIYNALITFLRTQGQCLRASEIDPSRYIDKRDDNYQNRIFDPVRGDLLHRLFENWACITDFDMQQKQMLLATLQWIAKGSDPGDRLVDVFLISEGLSAKRKRHKPRTHNSPDDDISNIFQGENPKATRRENLTYGGDRSFVTDRVTIHLRRFTIRESNQKPEIPDVPWFAVHIPDRLQNAIYIE